MAVRSITSTLSSSSAIATSAIRGGLPPMPIPILSLDLTMPDFMTRFAAMGGTYTRSGTKSYISADKTLKTAAANEWPLEYDITTGRPIGRSVYPTTAPNNTFGRDLTNAAWNTKSNVTVALDQVGIDGVANSASSVLATGTNGTVGQAITDAVSNKRGFSCYIKRLIGTGSVEMSVDGGSTWVTVTTELVANEWVRCFRVNGSSVTNPDIRIRLGTSGDKIAVDYAMCTKSDHIGAPTLGGSTTNADVPNLPVFGCPTSGCLAVRFHAISTGVGTRYAAALCASASEVRAAINLSSNTNAKINAEAIDSTSQVSAEAGQTSAPAYPVLERNKLWMPRIAAIQWKLNDYRFAAHGYLGAGDTSATLGDVTQLSIGMRYTDSATSLDGNVARIDIYPELSNDQIVLVSSAPDAFVAWGDSLAGTTGTTTADNAWAYLVRLWLGSQATPVDVAQARLMQMWTLAWGLGTGRPKELISQSVGGETSTQVRTRFDAALNLRQFTSIFIAGQNDSPGANTTTAAAAAAAAFANISAMVAGLGHDRFLVMTVPAVVADGSAGSVNRTYKAALNNAIRAAWPANCVDVETFFLTYGSDNSGGDSAAVAAGQIPPTCVNGSPHWSDKGHKLAAMAVLAAFERKGWVNTFTGSM